MLITIKLNCKKEMGRLRELGRRGEREMLLFATLDKENHGTYALNITGREEGAWESR